MNLPLVSMKIFFSKFLIISLVLFTVNKKKADFYATDSEDTCNKEGFVEIFSEAYIPEIIAGTY